MTEDKLTAAPPALDSNFLAMKRTVMAADRTLMAWVRTALSLISFGFTIYKLLEGLQGAGKAVASNAPRNAGLFLAAMGTLAMLMGTVEYWYTLKELHVATRGRLLRPPLIMAILMSLSGILLFVAIATRLF